MRPQSHRFAGLRITAAGIVAAGALIVACKGELPTDQSVAQMDVASAERMATLGHIIRDTVVYKVDGQLVDRATLDKMAANKALDIAAVEVQRGDGAGLKATSTIAITTVKGDTIAVRTNRLPYMRQGFKVRDSGFTGQALKEVEATREQALGRVLIATPSSSKEEFHGLYFINGKRANSADLQKLGSLEIKSVEVLKGPQAQKQYSDPAAAFGVIRVITK